MIVVVDQDDTLFDFNGALNKFLLETYGEKYSREDYKSFGLHETWNCSERETIKRIEKLYQSQIFRDMPILPGAQEIVEHFQNDYTILMTSKPEYMREITEMQIDGLRNAQGRPLINEIILSAGKCKADLCREIGADVILDDHTENIDKCQDIVPVRYVPVQPWNNLRQYVATENWNPMMNGTPVRGTLQELLQVARKRDNILH